MPRTPAKFTEADIRRAIRAAKAECGPNGWAVELRPSGSIVIHGDPAPEPANDKTPDRQPKPGDDDFFVM